jgi:uncharacterized membrane protein YgcG
MARDYRTLKLEILAETKQFVDDMKKSESQVEGFGGKMEKFGKVAAAAFAAAAAAAVAYAGKLAIDGVKAAIADEAAQTRLANALKNVTGATNNQIAAVEKQINQMSLSLGIADEQLRPAFQRLATATGDLSKAQEGLQLALDISASTGKSVEAVSNALGKAYEGNTGALSRLGIGLSAAEIKTLGLDGTMKQLADTFGGSATAQANTLEGQIQRLKNGFDEAKESVGAALLPAIREFFDYVTNRLIPILIEAKDRALEPIKKAFEDNKEAIQTLWQFTKDYLVPLFEFTLVRAIENVGKVIGSILNIIGTVVEGIKSVARTAIDAINALISAYNAIPFLGNINPVGLPSFLTTGGGVGMQRVTTGGGSTNTGFTTGTGSTGGGVGYSPKTGVSNTSVSQGVTSAVDKFAGIPLYDALKQLDTMLKQTNRQFNAGEISPYVAQLRLNQALADREALMGQVNVYVQAPSAIDQTGFTRAVVDALNSVERRQGGGASQLVGL